MPLYAKQKRILIVDDEAHVAFFLGEGLRGLGAEYEVHTTPSAETALQQFADRPYDLAVVDYRLPGLNGLDLLQRLRQVSPHTRTIVITAYSSPELEREALRLHASRYLEKPFPLQELMCTVEQVLA
jgi:DNA-binding NtrC family response regulator